MGKRDRLVARSERDARRVRELVVQAHDRLHRDDVDACHELLHVALGSGVYDGEVAPMADFLAFDEAFRRLCIANGVRASYVAVVNNEGRTMTGGDVQIDGYVCGALRAASQRASHEVGTA